MAYIEFNRQSNRLKDFDYSSNQLYYITIGSYQMQCIFGKIENNIMIKSPIGEIIDTEWKLINTNDNIETYDYVLMPNHLHGIIQILNHQMPLGEVIRRFKARCSRKSDFILWHRNYYEHIIRDDADYNRIAQYIANNPLKWNEDEYKI